MGKRSVTITAAWIGGICAIIAALILAVAQCLLVPPSAVGKGAPAVGDDSDPDSNSPRAIDSEHSTASKIGSFDDYLSRLATLKDRNLETQEFLDSMVGQQVVWRGSVRKVFDSGDDTCVTFSASRDSPGPPCATASFPSVWRTKLYALRNGDQIEVTAVFRESSAYYLGLEGVSFSLVDTK